MPSDQKNLRLDHTHCRAICDEIGERLGQIMRRDSADMSPHLQSLVDRLGELDTVSSPGIVPLIEDLQSSLISGTIQPV